MSFYLGRCSRSYESEHQHVSTLARAALTGAPENAEHGGKDLTPNQETRTTKAWKHRFVEVNWRQARLCPKIVDRDGQNCRI